MKRCIILLYVFLSICTIVTYASEPNKSVINFRRIEEEHMTPSSAVGISVNSSGDVAIGFNDYHINVYDQYGNFKYAFAFKLYGTYFFEFDDENNIMIFSVRGDTSYYFNTDAELIKEKEISDKTESNRYYRTHENIRNVSFDGAKYTLRQPFGYTKFVKIDENGNESVIYEIGSYYFSKIFFVVLILILVFVSIVLFVVIKTIFDEREKYKNSK